jgi:hypothetical protein
MTKRCSSPTSIQQDLEEPAGESKIALSWWGEKDGFQIKADITIHTEGEIFQQNVEWVHHIRANASADRKARFLTSSAAALNSYCWTTDRRPGAPDRQRSRKSNPQAVGIFYT